MELQPDHPHYDQIQRALLVLRKVIDPELFINIVDLGLVYDIDFSQPDTLAVNMTLSTPHCPLGQAIINGVENALHDEFPDRKSAVSLVWEPTWSFQMMTESGKQQLTFTT